MTNPIVAPTNGFVLSDKLYAKAKWFTTIVLPAISTFYFTMSGVWNLPYTTQVVGSFAALATFMGVVLGISTRAYNASDAKYMGDINLGIDPETGGRTIMLDISTNPDVFEQRKEITFKVNKTETSQ